MKRRNVTKYDDALSEAAYRLGRSKGEDFANRLVDRGTDTEEARIILEGYENDEKEVLALCPDPLSGEWADDPTPVSAINDISSLAEAEGLIKKANIIEALDSAEDLLDVYEDAYRDGFWETALKRANEIVQATSVE
jgi:hypothetical protein